MSDPNANTIQPMISIILRDLPRDYLSPSAMKTFKTCSQKWLLQYVEQLPQRPVSQLILGSQVHAGLQWADEEQIAKGARPSAKAVADMVADRIPGVIQAEQAKAGMAVEFKEGETVESIALSGHALAKAYEEQLGKTIEPVLVEAQFRLVDGVGGGDLLGRIDLLTKDGLLVDRKTSKRRLSALSALDSHQRVPYTLGAESLGHEVTGFALHGMIKKKGGVEIQVVSAPAPTDDEKAETLADYWATAQAMRTGFYPKVADLQTCSWCAFFQRCRPAVWEESQKVKAEE